MKFIKILVLTLLWAAALCLMAGCNEDKDTLSRAVMASSSSLYFDVDGGSQTITIYADADWVTVDCPDWVTVSPDTGSRVMDVTITVDPNYVNGEVDLPRSETIIFKGSTLESEAPVTVNQTGFNFRDASVCTVTEVYDLDDDPPVSLPDVIVVALGTSGFMVSDEAQENFVFITSSDVVSVGDKLSILGTRQTSNGLPVLEIFSYDTEATGVSVTLPEPTDITETIDSYNPGKWTYVCATGNLSGNLVIIGNTTYNVNIVEVSDGFGLDDLSFHNVTVNGFFAGLTAPYVRVFGVEIEDLGIEKVRYFYENFDWLVPYAEYYGCGDTIAEGSQATESSIYSNCPDVQAELDAIGYTFVVNKGTTGRYYLQSGYLKFGKTGYIAGIILPELDAIPKGTDIELTFNWSPAASGGSSRKYDVVSVEVLVGDTSVGTFTHDFEYGDKWVWLTQSVVIENYNPSNRITIRSAPWEEDFDSSGLQRFYLDEMIVEQADEE